MNKQAYSIAFVFWSAVISLIFIVSSPSWSNDTAGYDFPPRSNTAWIYDTINKPGHARLKDPGHFAYEIVDYNRLAQPGHKLKGLYIYGGSLEMYCSGKLRARCRESDLFVQYDPEYSSISAYRRKMAGHSDSTSMHFTLIVDGVVDAEYEGSLKGFNNLSQDKAEYFAEKLVRTVCKDKAIDGVQFDIEPLNITEKNGQYYFYRHAAKLLATGVPADGSSPAVSCRDKTHPRGLFFSIFSPARHLNTGSASVTNILEILTTYNNGYVIVPLYDLSSAPAGNISPLAQYKVQIERQIRTVSNAADHYKFKYKLGIPAAASVHEFTKCIGNSCSYSESGPVSQLQYVKSVMKGIDNSAVRESPQFLGVALWAWTRGISYGGVSFEPSSPPDDVLEYLAYNL